MALTPNLYQQRPVEPLKVEVVRFTEDNAEEVVEWMRRCGAKDVAVVTRDEGLRIAVPVAVGKMLYGPGWLLHVGGGEFRGVSDEDFERYWEPAPKPADPSLCSCVTPRVHGVGTGTGGVLWAENCLVCGRKLTPEALASVTTAGVA